MHVCSMFSDRPQKSWNLASLRRLMTNVVRPNNVILLSVKIFLCFTMFYQKTVPSQFVTDSPIPGVLQ